MIHDPAHPVAADLASGRAPLGLAARLGLIAAAFLMAFAAPLSAQAPAAQPGAAPAAGIASAPAAVPEMAPEPKDVLVTNDAVLLAILIGILAFIFATSSIKTGFWGKFYGIVPSLLLCYFLPSLLTLFEIADPKQSNLYPVVRDFLLPTALVLLTLSIDLPGVLKLGPKAIIMFLTATVGIMFGGPLAIIIVKSFNPSIVDGEVWRGLSTVAGTWIGGGGNQIAMKEIFMSPESLRVSESVLTPDAADTLFSQLLAVDILVAQVWMMGLLFIAQNAKAIDKRLGNDASAIEALKNKIISFQERTRRVPTTTHTMVILGVGFGVTGLSHMVADWIVPLLNDAIKGDESLEFLKRIGLTSRFFWLMVCATTGGLILSFTKARELEGVGASRMGSVFIYVLVAVIGMKMDLTAVGKEPGLFLVGGLWMLFHVILLFMVGYFIKAPMFFMAVGSKANVGGAASAPIIASAFHPSLAPVGVLLAVLGYALGTYCAWASGLLMAAVSP